MHLRGEERLVYEQSSKGRRSSRPGGTPSGCGRHRRVLGRPASLRTSSMTVEISRGTTWRLEKLGFGEKK
jgi:hypothetical protein